MEDVTEDPIRKHQEALIRMNAKQLRHNKAVNFLNSQGKSGDCPLQDELNYAVS